ncbi:MAG TPA: magnesium transporter [Methylomirabilota bacterium]|nr:magnesium transporter [Methylomirabilota bacterium]
MENTERLSETVRDLVESGRRERLAQVLEEAHSADIAAALRDLPVAEQVTVFRLLTRDQAGAVLAELDDPTLSQLAQALDPAEISGMLERLPPDDAAQVLEELPAEQSEQVLDLMKEEKSEEVQELLEYGEKTAGRIMSPNVLAVHENISVAQAIEQVRKSPVAETAQTLYLVDDHDHLVGSLPWRRLITADAATPVGLLRQEEPVSVTPETDQEEVAKLVDKYKLMAVPVVDHDHRLLGVITVDDIIDIIREEATEDIQRFGGVPGDETVFDPPSRVGVRRTVWLLINLATAILAASVIGLFEHTIQMLVVLAVFMPIVASMGGIGTTQTATVVVRGLALGDMTAAHLWRVLRKEMILALGTGLFNGMFMAGIAYVWKGQFLLALIIGLAMIINMQVAAVVGVLIPLALKSFRVDPAIASSVIITTFTDVCGFFTFLGLATLLIKFLL